MTEFSILHPLLKLWYIISGSFITFIYRDYTIQTSFMQENASNEDFSMWISHFTIYP